MECSVSGSGSRFLSGLSAGGGASRAGAGRLGEAAASCTVAGQRGAERRVMASSIGHQQGNKGWKRRVLGSWLLSAQRQPL